MRVQHSLLLARAAFLIALGLLTLMLVGCGHTDVTNDPAYGFSGIVGTWKTKTTLWLMQQDKELFITTIDEGPSTSVIQTLSVLPVGTELRIEHLMSDRTTEAGELLHATGSLTSGPYAGKQAWLVSTLFAQQRSPEGTAVVTPGMWSVAPDKLGK